MFVQRQADQDIEFLPSDDVVEPELAGAEDEAVHLREREEPEDEAAEIAGETEASEDEVEEFFANAKATYNERGIMDTRADIEDLDWISEDLVIVTVRWPHLDQNEKEVGAERSSYTLFKGEDGGYKVRVITMRGEEQGR